MDKKMITRIADLARLELSDREAEQMADQLQTILDHFKSLEEPDLSDSDIEPYAADRPGLPRPDKIMPSLPRQALLKNTAQVHEGFIKVPRVME